MEGLKTQLPLSLSFSTANTSKDITCKKSEMPLAKDLPPCQRQNQTI